MDLLCRLSRLRRKVMEVGAGAALCDEVLTAPAATGAG